MQAVYASASPDGLQLGLSGGVWLQIPSALLPGGAVTLVDDGSALAFSGGAVVTVADLADKLFGNLVRRAMARRGGLTKSPARAAASRRNGCQPKRKRRAT